MRVLLLALLTVQALLGGAATLAMAADAAERPNILLIVGDDIGFGDLGISGSVTNTPTLERLAKHGLTFTRFHASPVCSVTRAMLLTGNDPIDIGLAAFDYAVYPPAKGKPGYETYLTPTTATIAELLRDAGYRTYMVGKWHLGSPGPIERGFDEFYGFVHDHSQDQWSPDRYPVSYTHLRAHETAYTISVDR